MRLVGVSLWRSSSKSLVCLKSFVLGCIFIILAFTSVTSANLMGVDFGSSYLKVSTARPGHGLELVTNEQAKRKTPAAVGFTPEGERLFGDAALAYAAKQPDRVILYGRDMLSNCKGKGLGEDGPECKRLTKTIEGLGTFNGEQVAAMLLSLARRQAADSLRSSFAALKNLPDSSVIKDAVITVPPWFSMAQRGSLLDAASLINLNVLSLINTPTAAALKYALDNKGIVANNASASSSSSTVKQNILIYDSGASSASATIAEITTNIKKKQATHVTILSHGSTQSISGRALDAVVVDKLSSDFDSQRTPTAEKINSLPRALVRLTKAAQRAREILSANADTSVNIPSLHEDVDFKSTIKRSDLESAAAELFSGGEAPVKEALALAGLSASSIDAVVPVGGLSRTPRVQEGLLRATERTALNKSLNADEAAVLGAAFYAASLSSTFRVRGIALSDVHPFSVSAIIDRPKKKSGLFSGGRSASEDTQRVQVFPARGKMPSRKSVTLSRSEDFGVRVVLDDGKETLLSKFVVKGVAKVLDKLTDTKRAANVLPKVSLNFKLDSSGIISVKSAEAAVDETIITTHTPPPPPPPTPPNSASPSSDVAGASPSTDKESTTEKPSARPSPIVKSQTIVHRESVALVYDDGVISISNARLSSKEKKDAAKALQDLEAADIERAATDDARNALESALLSARSRIRAADSSEEDEDDLEVASLQKVSTPDERRAALSLIDSLEEWIFGPEARILKNISAKQKELTESLKGMFFRAQEYRQRPQAVSAFESSITKMRSTFGPLRELHLAGKSEHISKFDEFAEALTQAENWLKENQASQDKKLLTDAPVFTVGDVLKKEKELLLKLVALGRLKAPESPSASPELTSKEEEDGRSEAPESSSASPDLTLEQEGSSKNVENETAKGPELEDKPEVEPQIPLSDAGKVDAGSVDVKTEL